MLRKYNCERLNLSRSSIDLNDGNTCTAIARPSAGFSSDTRFFGIGNQKLFVVKRPKYRKYSSDRDIIATDKSFVESYRQEQIIWNLVYPDNKASLVTEKGLRLILPVLPGNTLTDCLSKDELTACLQLLSVAKAIKQFHLLGFTYADFNTDNVLIEDKGDGTFKAYLIDFASIDRIENHFGAFQELALLARLIPGCDWRNHFQNPENMIKTLTQKIIELIDTRTKDKKTLPQKTPMSSL